MPAGNVCFACLHERQHAIAGLHRIRARRQIHNQDRRRLAVQAAEAGVILRAQLRVAQYRECAAASHPAARAPRCLSNCSGRVRRPGAFTGYWKSVPAVDGRLPDGARGILPVLRLNRVADIGGRHAELRHLVRIHPHAHAVTLAATQAANRPRRASCRSCPPD